MKALKCDLNKTMFNAGFLFAILLTTVLCFTATAYTDPDTEKTYSVFEALFTIDKDLIKSDYSFSSIKIFEGALSGYVSMFLPIIVAFPFMVSFCSERNSGLIRLTIVRTGKIKYYLSKFFSSFLCGGTATMLGVTLYGALIFLIFPNIDSYNLSAEELSWVVTSGVKEDIVRMLIAAFFYGAITGIPAFFLSSFCRNPYIITCIPFLFVYIWDTTLSKITLRAFETGNYDVYEKVSPFYPNGIIGISYWTEFDKTTAATLIFNLCYMLVGVIGFIVIMNLRTDKGA